MRLTWYDGGFNPPTPEEIGTEKLNGEGGILYIGSKGKMLQDTYGLNPRLLPQSLHDSFGDPKQKLARIVHEEHEMNWAEALKGKAGVANARLAYQAFEEVFATPRWKNLADDGANAQRPLWASTGVKDPAYPDTLYVLELVAPHTVNTMPEKTLEAVADHGEVTGDTVTGTYEDAGGVLDALEGLGISYAEVTAQLEREGVDKFTAAWGELIDEAQSDLDLARADVEQSGKQDDQ